MSSESAPPKQGRRQFDDKQVLQAKVETILKQHNVKACFTIEIVKETQRRGVRAYQDRGPRCEESSR